MPIRPASGLAQALLLSVALVGAPVLAASAQEDAGQEGAQENGDPVVARVNGEEIYRSEAMQAIANLPEQYQQVPAEVLLPAIAEQLAIGRLIQERAEEAGLPEDETVQERLEQARMSILQEVWLQRRVEERMTDEAVQQAYDAFLEANPPGEEVKARHILVETEEEAGQIIQQLDEGADFSELAAEHSIGPSGEEGGDLGWFQEGQMVEPFGEVAFALDVGDYSEDPVETQFGWHVIQVDDRRTVEPPSLDEVRERLEGQLAQGIIQEVIQDLRAEADIELVGPAAEAAEAAEGAMPGPSPSMETGDEMPMPEGGGEATDQ
jgi:peptidyl-prolyl cis-trans isomerase C